jgi:hypothetical protein
MTSSLELFAATRKRASRMGLIFAGGVVMFLLCLVVGGLFSLNSDFFAALILGSWLAIPVGIIAANRTLRCPECRKTVARAYGDYCPERECGTRSLSQEHWWSFRTCAACGRELRCRKGGRLFKVRYCGHCGCHLHEHGF